MVTQSGLEPRQDPRSTDSFRTASSSSTTQDIEAVVRVLRSDYLTTGPEIDAFEDELAAACGARYAVVVANGTAALHCAYAAAGVGAGDEVVTTPLTFSATANTVLALGGQARVRRRRPTTSCLDPGAAEQRGDARERA